MIKTYIARALGTDPSGYGRRITPLWIGTASFWAAVFLVALAGGLILAKENLTHDVMLFASLGGVLLLCLPIEWLFVALVVSTWVIAPSLQYFVGIKQFSYVGPALAIVVGAKIFLIAALNRVQSRSVPNAPRHSAAVVWCVYLYFLTLVVSIVVNRPPAYQMLMALKLYLPFWSVFFIIAFGFLSHQFVAAIWRWLIPLAVLQLPFTIYQHFVIAPSRPDGGYVTSADAVVGTFGGDPMGGGNAATLMIFLIAGMLAAIAMNRCGRITRRAMFMALGASFASLTLGETKAAFFLLPIALIIFDLRVILARPARLLGMALIFGPVMFGMYRVYAIWYGTDTSSSYGYMINPSEIHLLTGEVGRVASLVLWWTDPQADLRSRLVGYGPAATYSGGIVSNGIIAKRYRPLIVAATTAAAQLWEIGVVGATAFAAVLISGAFLGLRQLPLDHGDESRQLVGVATALSAVLLITIVYNPMLLNDGATQILFMLCTATLHTFSARLIREPRQLALKNRVGAAVWGVLQERKH